MLPLCWVILPTYKTHKIKKNECKCQEICPCSWQSKKELVYVTYERAVTRFFSDGVIPLGSLLLASIKHIFLQFVFPVWFIPLTHLEKHAQGHPNCCTAKPITILIEQGSISCPNTDNKELHTRCIQILSPSFTTSGNDKANPSRTANLFLKSPKPQMPELVGSEYVRWTPRVRTAHSFTHIELRLRERHYLTEPSPSGSVLQRAIDNYSISITVIPGRAEQKQ